MGYQSYLFYALKASFFKDDLIGGGTIFAAVTKKDMETIELMIPNIHLLDEFNIIAGDIDRQISILSKQNKQLAQARDLLLPKLMSGDLAV